MQTVKNEPIPVEFLGDYIAFEADRRRHFGIQYMNRKNGRAAMWSSTVEDLEDVLKVKGWLFEYQNITDASFSDVTEWIKLIASEELHIREVLALEKSQRGIIQLGVEISCFKAKLEEAQESIASLIQENIRLKLGLLTGSDENHMFI